MAEPWIRVHSNLAEKRVAIRASDQLRVSINEAIGLLVRFWGAMSRLGDDGMVAPLTDREIETWAGWRGKRGAFAAFIRDMHTDPEGRVNEWDEYQGALEHRRAVDRDRQRRRRDERRLSRGESNGSHADSPRDDRDSSAPARAVRNETKRNETTSSSSSARDELLRSVPHRPTWEAELDAALQGMHGPPLTVEQLDRAVSDYVGNGAAKTPNLRHFRAYLRDAARVPMAAANGAAGSIADPTVAALERWKAETDARERRA